MKDNRHSMSRGIYNFGFTGAVKSSEGLKSGSDVNRRAEDVEYKKVKKEIM